MKSIIGRILCLVVLLHINSCIPEQDGPYGEGRFIKDEFGRTLILHGLNTSSSAKYAGNDYLPWIDEQHVDRELTWGFNVVRFLTSWIAIEPDSGQYDHNYLEELATRIKWYTDRGIYVVLDMHQDVYGPAVGGNGHPEWATKTNGLEYVGGYDEWWLNNLDPATINAYQNFWKYTDYAYLQDHYINAWLQLVNRFRDDPFVLGYDLMNEPHAGDLRKTFDKSFEKGQLKRFYERLIPAIRSIDNNKYIFFEGQSLLTNFGMLSHLGKLEDPRQGERRLAYAPHCYPLFVDLGGVYNQAARNNLKLWEDTKNVELNRHRTPMFIGEFGLSPEVEGFDDFIRDHAAMADRMQAHWAYWSNDLGGWSPLDASQNETPILELLIRVYPQATAGRLLNFMYDPVAREFEMRYKSNSAVTMPTEIFIPQRFYEGGWDFTIEGTESWSHVWDPVSQRLKVWIAEDNVEILVKVFPG